MSTGEISSQMSICNHEEADTRIAIVTVIMETHKVLSIV